MLWIVNVLINLHKQSYFCYLRFLSIKSQIFFFSNQEEKLRFQVYALIEIWFDLIIFTFQLIEASIFDIFSFKFNIFVFF